MVLCAGTIDKSTIVCFQPGPYGKNVTILVFFKGFHKSRAGPNFWWVFTETWLWQCSDGKRYNSDLWIGGVFSSISIFHWKHYLNWTSISVVGTRNTQILPHPLNIQHMVKCCCIVFPGNFSLHIVVNSPFDLASVQYFQNEPFSLRLTIDSKMKMRFMYYFR